MKTKIRGALTAFRMFPYQFICNREWDFLSIQIDRAFAPYRADKLKEIHLQETYFVKYDESRMIP